MDGNDKRWAQNSALYRTLSRDARQLRRLFVQISGHPFFRGGRMPDAEELRGTPLAELEEGLALCGGAQDRLARLPRELRPFFNIIARLLLYFRSLRACLAELAALEGETLNVAVRADKKYQTCLARLEDCRNMAEELARQWQAREELLEEAAHMLELCRKEEADMPEDGEEGGALGLFIASSKIKKYK